MIETRGLTKAFGDLVAVNGLDLRVRKGRIHGFVGPNGAGKTTTMKMLIGSIRGTKGEASSMVTPPAPWRPEDRWATPPSAPPSTGT